MLSVFSSAGVGRDLIWHVKLRWMPDRQWPSVRSEPRHALGAGFPGAILLNMARAHGAPARARARRSWGAATARRVVFMAECLPRHCDGVARVPKNTNMSVRKSSSHLCWPLALALRFKSRAESVTTKIVNVFRFTRSSRLEFMLTALIVAMAGLFGLGAWR